MSRAAVDPDPDVDADVDVVVVGGGPVGLATALELRRRGLSATVVEPRAAPVDKACGEGLMPSAVRRLAGLGVRVEGRPFTGIRYVGRDRDVSATFRAGPGLGVRRTVLHGALAEAVDRARAERVTARVGQVCPDAGGVRVDVPGSGSLRAHWVVGADGLHSGVRRGLGLDAPPPPWSAVRYGLRRHFAVAPWTDRVEVHWAPSAEAYVTPVDDHLVGVAVLGPAGTGFDEALAAMPALTARLRGAEPATAVRGAGPLWQSSTAVRHGRVLLVGDAAGYVDALTGEGLATGLAAAGAAARAIAAGRPDTYPAAWARLTRRHRVLTTALLRGTGWPPARAALVPAAARLPRVFAAAVDLLA